MLDAPASIDEIQLKELQIRTDVKSA
jgi:hypothetical protein